MTVRPRAAALLGGVALIGGSVAVALSLPASAGGNTGSGIVRVDGREFETSNSNEPKVGCIFQIDFFNYEEGDTHADVNFELQPPTTEPENTLKVNGDTRVFIGDDPANGPEDQDASETYTLEFTGEPEAQGYHVKLTINAEGTQAADKRHKVYYVDCPPVEPTSPPTSVPPTSEPTSPPTANPTPPVPTVIVGGIDGPADPSGSASGGPNLLPLAGGLAVVGLALAGLVGLRRRS